MSGYSFKMQNQIPNENQLINEHGTVTGDENDENEIELDIQQTPEVKNNIGNIKGNKCHKNKIKIVYKNTNGGLQQRPGNAEEVESRKGGNYSGNQGNSRDMKVQELMNTED